MRNDGRYGYEENEFTKFVESIAQSVRKKAVSDFNNEAIQLSLFDGPEPQLYLTMEAVAGSGEYTHATTFLRECVLSYEVDHNETLQVQQRERKFIEAIISACNEFAAAFKKEAE